MRPRLGRAFPPDWEGYPPHMSARDFQLWIRFTKTHPTLATAYHFDVTLGNGDPSQEPSPEPMNGMWRSLTSYRADVIANTPDGWTLIELRDNASSGALGALILYAHLWHEDPPDTRPLTLLLVTNRIHPDLAPLLPKHSIHLVIV
jgi:hypothetical protein